MVPPQSDLWQCARVAILEKIKAEGPVTVLVAGRTGAGKSSTVNLLLGEDRAKVSDDEVGTHFVTPHAGQWRGVPILIYDTPGFGDEVEDRNNDQEYLRQIGEIPRPPDIVALVTGLNSGRANNEVDEIAMRLIIGHFGGPALLRSMALAFTFAEMFGKNYAEWAADRQKQFAQLAKVDLLKAAQVPVFSVPKTTAATNRASAADQLWIKLLGRCYRVKFRCVLLGNGKIG